MDIKDVEKLAELARIELALGEKKGLLKDLQGILEYVRQIERVETKETKPQIRLRNVWREDKVETRDFSRELIISQFSDKQNGFLKVKKIL